MNVQDRLRLLAGSLGEQKGLWFWLAKYAVVFAVFLFFFLPIHGRLSNNSSELHSLRKGIEDLKKISVSLLSPEEVERIGGRVHGFESKLIDATKAAKLLDEITDLAEKNHFNVIQIYSDSPVLIKDLNGKELEVNGKKLSLLPVNFRIETDYKNLANFLKDLADTSSGTYTVESLHLQRTPAENEILQCDITLSYIAR